MQLGFFDIDNCYARLDGIDNLQKLDNTIDWRSLSEVMNEVSFDAQEAVVVVVRLTA